MRKNIWIFLCLELAFLTVVFIIGLVFLAPDAAVVGQTFVGIGQYLSELAVKTSLAIVLTLIQSSLFLKFCLNIPLSDLKQRFQISRNDSHAYFIVGIAGSVVASLILARGVNIHQYLYCLCTKMPVGYFISVIITAAVARSFGVKSTSEFRQWVDQEDNDSYAILISGILVLSMVLAMAV